MLPIIIFIFSVYGIEYPKAAVLKLYQASESPGGLV